ncbi:hypothetical protein [Micromonospora sp. WMMD710]|uniref:hypothetical protein n=1 Tax=Micromonospora sp. WMMD710 TaxID=3016085 RepID=UPI0024174322|nr:hypothetical protein [Micromonospora sp. WMMD710]MDG4756302.1 hypothetical protein [Micromonospora sp. WMMD710]MDG4762401.1 hypothetical protein [Micromonospora sp. WMMD710]MDG4762445.1 hypothetical protein [Micromonospora sp. WMMD710]MDG4762480.1 hypothetical protein [Micromonospora sp. WMMD710]
MSGRGLNDAELRVAAARRPGYATYPQYRPGQAERLGRLPAAVRPAVPVVADRAEPANVRHPLDGRRPLPTSSQTTVTLLLESLPPARIYDFVPRLIEARPWWQPRWHWGVLAADGRKQLGYAWTQGGARRRTARAARRAAR